MDTPYRRSDQPVVWERPAPGARADVRPLDRAALVSAAVAVADRGGLGEASVRKVAAELDVGPMRFYRYIETVEELHELMVDEVYAEALAAAPTRARSWRRRVEGLVLALRAAILDHEWAADLLGRRPALGPHGLAYLERLTLALGGAPGVDGAEATWVALGAVHGHLVGAVRRDVADRRAVRTEDGEPAWQARVAPYLARMLETGDYPTVRDLVGGPGRPPPDVAFARELAVVLDGLATERPGG